MWSKRSASEAEPSRRSWCRSDERPPRADQFGPIMGRWKVDADFDLGPPTHIAGESVHEWLGELLVIRSQAEDPVPSSISVVAGREDVQGKGGRPRHRPAVRVRRALSMRGSRWPRPIAHASFRVKAVVPRGDPGARGNCQRKVAANPPVESGAGF